ncbi:MAG TPA: plasmid mobilization relaxosome protein MobC [Caproicibacter sp.]|nr:plasmid mobilization relaxosome protein MobC [Caproicibacter sp.]
MEKKRKRTNAVLLRFSTQEISFLQKKMIEAGIKNRSAYLRKMALDGYIIRQDYTVLNKFVNELNRIGNNLNQMAKIANTYGDINKPELETIEKDIDKIWRQLSSLG